MTIVYVNEQLMIVVARVVVASGDLQQELSQQAATYKHYKNEFLK